MPGTSGPDHMFPDEPETTSYMVQMPADDWEDWKDTVPRSIPLYEQLHNIIQRDTEYARVDDTEIQESDVRLVLMKFERIEQRTENALKWVDEGDENKLRKEIQSIRDIASSFTE